MQFIINININIKRICSYFAFVPQEIFTEILSSLIKHPLSLFILLLIGYSQLFAPLYRGSVPYAPAKKIAESSKGQALDVTTTDVQTVFIAEEEEEENRISKKHSEYSPILALIRVPEYFLSSIKNSYSSDWNISCVSFSISSYLLFRVFRL